MYKRIKELREDHDKKQLEVAKLLEISQQYYSEYEMRETYGSCRKT